MNSRRIITIAGILSSILLSAKAEDPDSIQIREMNEIVVKGETPLIKSVDGNMIVDLPLIVKDKPVTNIYEAIAYLPGIINNNGYYELAGTNGVTFIINGKPTNMPVQNLYQLLYSTPVDRLKNIEIMYAAPAKYHVSGAVINIVLKNPRAIDGLTGQISGGYNQSYYASYNTGIAATYAYNDWAFDVNWSTGFNKTRNHQETNSNHVVDHKLHVIYDDMKQIKKNISNTLYTSISYKTFKFIYNGQVTSDSKAKSTSDGTFGEYVNRYTFTKPINYHNLSLSYNSPVGLSIGGDFTIYQEKRNQFLRHEMEELVDAYSSQSINKYHAYIDMEHRFNNWKLNYGIEYQHSDDKSRQIYNYPPQPGFDNRLDEDVADSYIGVQKSFSNGLSFNTSAKAEYFHNSFIHNWNFIPQLGVTYYKTPKSIFQLSFTSQRVYPQYWELHGGTSYINDYAYVVGNPKLQPYINYSSQFSYILNQKYSATLYFLYADKYSVQLPYQMTDALNLVFQTQNLDYSQTLGLQLQAPVNIGNILNSIIITNISHKREKASIFHDLNFDNKRWSFYGALNNTIMLSSNCPVYLTLNFAYISGQIQGPGRFNSFWKLDAGAKWTFGKNKCCELNLIANDLFNKWNPKLTIKYANQDYKMTIHDMERNLRLTFVWKFNGFKPKTQSIDTSRFGTDK